jgi:DNA-binding transcriptional MerR regulator
MAMEFKIGDFARLVQVSVKTLHYYDDIKLFRPARVDPFTGYRYYTLEQAAQLNRIIALRDLGFALEQVQALVDDAVSAEEMRGMLRLRRAQLAQEIESAQAKLARVDVRLRWIEKENKMPDVEVLVKHMPAVVVAGARTVVNSPEQMREQCMALDAAACRLIEQAQLATDGISLALYYGNGENGIDVEMAYTVGGAGEAVEPIAGAKVHTLPAAQVAYAVYHGSYDDFAAVGQLHAGLRQATEEQGYQVAGACREYYLQPPRAQDEPIGIMEIQYPVAKRQDAKQ